MVNLLRICETKNIVSSSLFHLWWLNLALLGLKPIMKLTFEFFKLYYRNIGIKQPKKEKILKMTCTLFKFLLNEFWFLLLLSRVCTDLLE